jgi:hypothetical protein
MYADNSAYMKIVVRRNIAHSAEIGGIGNATSRKTAAIGRKKVAARDA